MAVDDGDSSRRTGPKRWLVTAVFLAAIADLTGSCQSTSSPPPTGTSPPPTATSPPPTATHTLPTTAIVLYEAFPARIPQPTVDATFTDEKGDPETQKHVTLPWSAGLRVPAGSPVSLSVTTNDIGNSNFTCRIHLNGRQHEASAQPVTEGNEITGWRCQIGPITARPEP